MSDFNIATVEGTTVFAVDYVDAYNDLMDYYLTLPQDAAPQDLINKAKELIPVSYTHLTLPRTPYV